jgi:hypothetical protein
MLERIGGQIKFNGYFGEVWRVLEKRMEFRYVTFTDHLLL